MDMTPVESSNIESIGFDAEKKLMRIKFLGGGLYEYSGASIDQVWADLMAAASKGKHFTKHIRHNTKLLVERIS